MPHLWTKYLVACIIFSNISWRQTEDPQGGWQSGVSTQDTFQETALTFILVILLLQRVRLTIGYSIFKPVSLHLCWIQEAKKSYLLVSANHLISGIIRPTTKRPNPGYLRKKRFHFYYDDSTLLESRTLYRSQSFQPASRCAPSFLGGVLLDSDGTSPYLFHLTIKKEFQMLSLQLPVRSFANGRQKKR